MFGMSRQAYYKQQKARDLQRFEEAVILLNSYPPIHKKKEGPKKKNSNCYYLINFFQDRTRSLSLIADC